MKKIYQLSVGSLQFLKQEKLFLTCFFLIFLGFSGKAQTISGLNPYCVSSNPSYTVSVPAGLIYNEVKWTCSDPGVTLSGNPSPLSLSKVLYKYPGTIAKDETLKVEFLNNGILVGQSVLVFLAAETPVPPSYYVTKTSDYCTSQYHIITLNIVTNPNPSPNSNFSISPRIADPTVVITQTSKNVFELKLPLNGVPYFLYDISCTSFTSGCQSNSITTTSYSNLVSLNLTNCTNNSSGTNYEFTVSPNPYSNGYITITAPPVTQALPATCRIYNSSGILKATFLLTNSNTAFALKSTVGSSLIPGMYVVQVTYSNGIVKTKNLIVI